MKTETTSDSSCREGKSGASLKVFAFGNPFAGDDAAGPALLEGLRDACSSACKFHLLRQPGLELLPLLRSGDVVLFIDAVESGAPAGTLHLIPLPSPGLAARALGSLSGHGWGLTETIDLARALGEPLPRMMLLGIELGQTEHGAPRSRAVEEALITVQENFSRLCALLREEESLVWRLPLSFPPGDRSFPGVL
ncbi:MAG: hydrogenase maturation protease [Acidobacteria bacterium]|nr:hydrogenase maturation protease [Acidobacteriota bacterium]MBI3663972.1 hydrogenase maturation protease [Acidobacteriota bacterium]